MQTASAQLVMQAAAEDRSYAGAFAYDSQTPHKVFMGEVPCVPLPTVVDALDQSAGQGAGLKPQDIDALRKVIGMDVASCSTKCSPALWECVANSSGKTLGDKLAESQVQACMQHSLACYQSCIAKTPGSA